MEPNVWWVLAYDQYYPEGGLGDVYKTCDSEEAANAVAAELKRTGSYDYVEVENVSHLLYNVTH